MLLMVVYFQLMVFTVLGSFRSFSCHFGDYIFITSAFSCT